MAGTTATRFVGIWDLERALGPQIAGPVTVVAGPMSEATVAGFSAGAASSGAAIVFTFPGNRGELRFTSFDTGRIVAMWLQPANVTGTRYATPVILTPIGPGIWRGRIEPLADRLDMALHIVARPDGSVGAFLRDELFNIGRRYPIASVRFSGNALRFVEPDGTVIVAALDDAKDTFTLRLPHAPLRDALTFVRRGTSNPVDPNATYRIPIPTGDGWPLSAASDAGISTTALVDLARFASAAPTSETSPAVHAILVARHGKLVFDNYFNGFDESMPHDTRSAGKTYADVLTGVAIARGAPIGDQTPLLTLFPSETGLANDDPRKRDITLGNALSMSTGLDCDDDDEKSVGNEDNEQNQTQQPDWYRLVLDARMVRDPGTKAVYCSASINLAGGAVAGATHAWLPLYFEEQLAEPLQMQRYALNLTPTSEMYLGGGAYIRPRDFLKIGQVFLDGGTWHGQRIVERDWIERSWRPRLPLAAGDDYGYAWHVRTYVYGGASYRAYEAQGNGGQILDVLPQLDLAVMMTQGNYNNFKTWGAMRDAIVQRVIAAIIKP